ncbi:putative Protein phosphatase 2C-like protein 1 [Cardiosporidium cionae]|uniref:PPM-type phosphatase domain-containing protein n=1 Tax=Cardiosporidium cionae TaxID=476202 RepID=A0ABQ7JED8_9APIC|nr:putative Protein phosphatase 2C-like protein 1 [Cardiosporidium cionae]|eukprot:KAF8822369.1 putative Protein phosphatase 2C-like protein 1 [Cardiosporidium cionae]
MGYATNCTSVQSIGWAADRGARPEMEDSFVVIDKFGNAPESCFAAVYDGHGGEENRRVLYCAHLGDSRALLCGRKNGFQRLTAQSDHKACDPDETLIIESYGGFVCSERVNAKLAVSRAFGNADLKRHGPIVSNIPDIKCLLLEGDEKFVILACDGLWDVMKDEHVVQFVLQFVEVLRCDCPDMTCDEASEVLARALIEEAMVLRDSGDNITVVVILLDSMGFKSNKAPSNSRTTLIKGN